MISPSSFSDFGFVSSVLFSGTPGSGTATAGNDPASQADSFQNIFAQAVTPPTNAEPLPSKSADFAESQNRPPSTTATQNSDRSNAKSTVRTSPARTSASKTERGERPAHAETGQPHPSSNSTNVGNIGSLAVQDSASANTTNTLGATDKRAMASPANSQSALPSSASTALGGSKALSGAAFAMHITAVGNQLNNGPGTATSAASASANNASAPTANSSQSTAVPGNTSNDLPSPINNISNAIPSAQPLAQLSPSANLSMGSEASWTAPSQALPSSDQAQATESAPQVVEVGEIAAEDPTGAPQPVRSLQLQLGADGASRVDLRLVEHAGGLSVSVRASDSNLTRGLQDNLPELSARLASEKYQTHTLIPATTETSSGQSSSNGSDQPSGESLEHSGNRSFSQGGSSAGGDGNPQRGEQQDSSQAWWRQLAALNKISAIASNSGPSSQPTSAANKAPN